jgi:hypothetical protein
MQKLKQGATGMSQEEADRPWMLLLDALQSIGSKEQDNAEMALVARYLKVSTPVDSRVTCTMLTMYLGPRICGKARHAVRMGTEGSMDERFYAEFETKDMSSAIPQQVRRADM